VSRPFDEITLEQVATYPRPGMAVPGSIGFTPDSKAVTFLLSAGGTLVRSLFAMDVETGARRVLAEAPSSSADEGALSWEEQLRRERARLRETGITSYAFARDADPHVLLVPASGRLYAARGDGGLKEVPGTEGALDAKLSPDGTRVAFVRGDEVWVAGLVGGEPRRLTHDAEPGVTNGVADFISHEEFGRSEGFWWSPDGTRIAYAQADSRAVPVYPIVHQGTDSVETEEHRYPFPGEANATVRLGTVSVSGGDTRWHDLGSFEYLARVAFRPDGRVVALVLSRDQRSMRWMTAGDGDAETLFEEVGEPWLNVTDGTRFLRSGEALLTSERTGFRHLYVLPADGGEPRALTSGEWVVTAIADLDEERRLVRFLATKETVRERHLYEVPLSGGEVRRITSEPGWHQAVFSPDHRRFVDTVSSLRAGYRVTLREETGAEAAVIHDDPGATAKALGLVPPELVSFPGPDGTALHGALYAPPGDAGEGPHPIVVSVYGGPHAQRVMNEWTLTVDLRCQHLARRGHLVLKVDNRGSANRGLAFEGALHRRFGTVEVDDQVAGVEWLAARPDADGDRVGVFGWSYGGYMTLMCMARRPDLFRVGVSGAPVTDWDGYDTGYTERYMETPESNPDGYREGSVLTHADRLEGDLLLIHGMVDENVHFRHTARLVASLNAAGRTPDLLLLPEERHMPRDHAGLLHLERRIHAHFARHL